MVPDDKSQKIGNAFAKYVKTSDKSLIESFTEEQIEMTLIQYSRQKGTPFYEAMDRRLADLKQERRYKRASKEKWKDRMIGVVLALIVGLILYLAQTLF